MKIQKIHFRESQYIAILEAKKQHESVIWFRNEKIIKKEMNYIKFD